MIEDDKFLSETFTCQYDNSIHLCRVSRQRTRQFTSCNRSISTLNCIIGGIKHLQRHSACQFYNFHSDIQTLRCLYSEYRLCVLLLHRKLLTEIQLQSYLSNTAVGHTRGISVSS